MKLLFIFLAALVLGMLITAAFADEPPQLYGADGHYLGNLSANPYDPNSVNNPYGRYGSTYSSESINNPYGRHGSPYSNESVNNPYATQAPRIIHRQSGYH